MRFSSTIMINRDAEPIEITKITVGCKMAPRSPEDRARETDDSINLQPTLQTLPLPFPTQTFHNTMVSISSRLFCCTRTNSN